MFFATKRWLNPSRLCLYFCCILFYGGYFFYGRLSNKIEQSQAQIKALASHPEQLTLPVQQDDGKLDLVYIRALQDLWQPIPGVCLQKVVAQDQQFIIYGFAHSYTEIAQALVENALFKKINQLQLKLAKNLPIIIFKAQLKTNYET